jgi:hypothetical protein
VKYPFLIAAVASTALLATQTENPTAAKPLASAEPLSLSGSSTNTDAEFTLLCRNNMRIFNVRQELLTMTGSTSPASLAAIAVCS